MVGNKISDKIFSTVVSIISFILMAVCVVCIIINTKKEPQPGDRVVIVDDLLATGGTVNAAINLIEKLGGEVVGCAFVIELTGLKGRELLNKYDVFSLINYEF